MKKIFLVVAFALFALTCKHENGQDNNLPTPTPEIEENIQFSSIEISKDGVKLPEGLEDDKIGMLKASFKIAKYEVTYSLWYDVYTWAIKNGYSFANGGKAGSTGENADTSSPPPTPAKPKENEVNLPVTMISWADAIVWCNAYSEKMGIKPCYYFNEKILKDSTNMDACNKAVAFHTTGYRLPNELEWAYVARYLGNEYVENSVPVEQQDNSLLYFSKGTSLSGGTLPTYDDTPFKKDDIALHEKLKKQNDELAVYNKYWNGEKWLETGVKQASEVGKKKPNKLGLYDVSGNVWEWCFNLFQNKAGYETYRVRRGGSWKYNAKNLQLGIRFGNSSDHTDEHFGFRLARWKEEIKDARYDGSPEPLENKEIKPEPPVQGKEAINPMYFLINNVVSDDFPEEVRKHLKDGTNPLYEVSGEKATISIEFWEDKAEKIIVNNDVMEIKTKEEAGQTVYFAEHISELPKGEKTKQFEILITPKDKEKYSATKYIFRLKGGKPLPPLATAPNFSINGISHGSMPIEVGEHLTDGTNPLYQIPSKRADIKIIYFTDIALNAEFKATTNNSSTNDTKQFEKKTIDGDDIFVAEYSTEITTEHETNFIITINPKNADEASPLTYTFRLKNNGTLQSLKGIFIVLNNKKYTKEQIIEKEITIPSDKAELVVLSETDVMQKVTINGNNTTIEEFSYNGKTYKGAEHKENLNTTGNNFEIIVEAKDKLKYSDINWKFKILPLPKTNAKFAKDGSDYDVGTFGSIFKEGIENEYDDDYGFLSAKFIAKPEDERASIYLNILSPLDDSPLLPTPIILSLQTEGDLKGYRASEQISAYPNKPTKFVVYVVAADGSTKDDENGKWFFIANYAKLKWGYTESTVDKLVYDEISLEKNKIQEDKIYLSVEIYGENPKTTNTTIATEDYPTTQTPPSKGGTGTIGDFETQWYNFALSINKTGTNKVVIPIKQYGKLAFVYEVPVNITQ